MIWGISRLLKSVSLINLLFFKNTSVAIFSFPSLLGRAFFFVDQTCFICESNLSILHQTLQVSFSFINLHTNILALILYGSISRAWFTTVKYYICVYYQNIIRSTTTWSTLFVGTIPWKKKHSWNFIFKFVISRKKCIHFEFLTASS